MRNLQRWSRRFLCHWCYRDQSLRVAAVIRVFSGSYGGEGWPACEAHAQKAITAAMGPITTDYKEGFVDPNWTVAAYAVECDEDGFPMLTKTLWTCRRRRQSLAPA